jgi:hypothetical protein
LLFLKYYFIGCWAHRTRVQKEGMPRDAYEMAYWCTFMRTRVAPPPRMVLYWSRFLLCLKLITNYCGIPNFKTKIFQFCEEQAGYLRISEESLLVIYTNSAIHWHIFFLLWLIKIDSNKLNLEFRSHCYFLMNAKAYFCSPLPNWSNYLTKNVNLKMFENAHSQNFMCN